MGLEEWLTAGLQLAGNPSRPTVTLSYAQSLDGSIALRRGERLALSGPESHMMTHQLRAIHDAILIGIGTVLSDDPQLSVRLVEGKDPQVVVLDSQLRTPLTARLLMRRPRIFCLAVAGRDAEEKLKDSGAVVERQSDEAAAQIDLIKMLSRLKELGIRSVMVEGGAEVISSFLSENLVDQIVITISPKFVGGYGISTSSGIIPEIIDWGNSRYGNDLVIWGKIATVRQRR